VVNDVDDTVDIDGEMDNIF